MKKRLASDEAILRAIGGEFAACRRERGFSQEDLAEIARVSSDKVSVIERGRRDYGMLAISGLYLLLECGGIIVGADGFVPLRDRPIGLRALRETTGVRAPSMLGMMGKALREARKARRLSLVELAAAARVHPNSLWNFEKGLVVPSICSYFRTMSGLEVDRITVEGGEPVFHNK